MSKAKKQQKAKSSVNWMWISLAAAAVVMLGVILVTQVSKQPAPSSAVDTALPAEVSVAEAATLRDQGAFILDVRQPEEWADHHVPDSTLIPLGELPGRLGELPRDREIIVVCRSGNRSAQGRDILLNAGFTEVTSMAGGLNEWRAQGFMTVPGSQ
ncbi:MAG: rhodanese-like domain-containing protein [Chloroflexi bacterium]|nr:rhodanese-like domain-containing protein [Chloroflexota bacterium]